MTNYKPYLREMNIIRQHQQQAPVQTVSVANALGINVVQSNYEDTNVSGEITRTGDSASGFTCYVNAAHPVTRRRFTIAHEISHFILHRNEIGDGIVDDSLYRSWSPSRQDWLSLEREREANELAADILMPMHLLEPLRQKHGNDVKKLAEIFNVSQIAMRIQLGMVYDD